MSRYLVKFQFKGKLVHGLYEQFKTERQIKSGKIKAGQCICADAVLPTSYIVEKSKLEDVEMNLGTYDREAGRYVDCDEHHRHIEDEFTKARELSRAVGKGVHKNKLFSIGVADGYAWYVITRVNKKTCRVEWRGFCPDRYTDHHYGWGCKNYPIEDVARYCNC